EFITAIAGNDNPFAIPVAAVIGIPMYIRVETMIPISEALVAKGMSMGAVIALIIGGAGASLPEVLLLNKLFKPRLLAAFIVAVFTGAVTTGQHLYFIFQAGERRMIKESLFRKVFASKQVWCAGEIGVVEQEDEKVTAEGTASKSDAPGCAPEQK